MEKVENKKVYGKKKANVKEYKYDEEKKVEKDGKDIKKDYFCLECNKVILEGEVDCIGCELCGKWSHVNCTMSMEVFKQLTGGSVKIGSLWYACGVCSNKKTSYSTDNRENVSTQTIFKGYSPYASPSSNIAIPATADVVDPYEKKKKMMKKIIKKI